MKRNICYIILGLLVAFAFISCAEEPMVSEDVLGDISFDSSVALGGGVDLSLLPAKTYVTYTFVPADGGEVTKGEVKDSKITLPKERGIYTLSLKYSNATRDVVIRVFNPENAFDTTFNGLGIESYPYEIPDGKTFEKLGNEDVQKAFVKKESDGLFFALTGDIDLSKHIGMIGTYFGGTLDGNGHYIKASNDMPFMFLVFFTDTCLKDFTVKLADTNTTTFLKHGLAARCEKLEQNVGTYKYSYDKPELSLKFQNVDFETSSDSYCTMGDNNYGLYKNNNGACCYAVLEDDTKELGFYRKSILCHKTETGVTKELTFSITLEDCDVKGNFIGGFGGSGAAIFLGGQLNGIKTTIKDCSFDGNLVGYNVGQILANIANCDKTGIIDLINFKAGNVKFTSDTNKFNAFIGNVSDKEKDMNVFSTLDSSSEAYEIFDSVVKVSKSGDEITFTKLDDALYYDVKLFLPSLYWYEKGNYSAYKTRTDSNTVTIRIAKDEDVKLYDYKVITNLEAEKNSIAINWDEVSTKTVEGHKYTFKDNYFVIQYIDPDYDYSYGENTLENIDTRSDVQSCIVVARGANNSVLDISKKTEVK